MHSCIPKMIALVDAISAFDYHLAVYPHELGSKKQPGDFWLCTAEYCNVDC